MRLFRFLRKCILIVLTIVTVAGGTLVSAVNISVTIQCAGTVSYESVNPEEGANEVGNSSSGAFDYALENIDESNHGDAIEKPNIVKDETRHLRLQP